VLVLGGAIPVIACMDHHARSLQRVPALPDY
jgi:hypothetical protein